MSSYPIFDGNDLKEWTKHFGFTDTLYTGLTESLGVTTVKDLSFVYGDEELLKELESLTKRLEFLKFKQMKDFTKELNPDILKKQKEFEEWVEANKLGNVLDLLKGQGISDLAVLLQEFQTNSAKMEAIYANLKPIPLKRFKQCLQELENNKVKTEEGGGGKGPAATASTTATAGATTAMLTMMASGTIRGKNTVETAMNTTLTLEVDDDAFEEWEKTVMATKSSGTTTTAAEIWECHLCRQKNEMKLTKCRDCFTAKKGGGGGGGGSSVPSTVAPSLSTAAFIGFSCDSCRVSPITGPRYKCTIRPNYDLCETCERKSIQPYPMLKLYEPDDQPMSVETIYPDKRTYKQTVYVPGGGRGGMVPAPSSIAPLPVAAPVKTSPPPVPAPASSAPSTGKYFRDFGPLKKSEEEHDYPKTMKVKDSKVSVSYWIGYYGIKGTVRDAINAKGINTVKELGKKWHEDTKFFDNCLANVEIDKKERGKVIRGLNDAENLYLEGK